LTRVRIDAAIRRLADSQHGVVARWQLLDLGIGTRAIEHRIELGRLSVVHRGVYSVGHGPLTRRGRLMAAVLAGGPGAVLSHWSAAALWGIRGQRDRIDVTVPNARRSRDGISFHRSSLMVDEFTLVDEIPVTTVARTILDLAAVGTRHDVERAIAAADDRQLTDVTPLSALVDRYPRRRGVATVKEILAEKGRAAGITRSELEDRFLLFLDAQGLPPPKLNFHVDAGDRLIECDCLWPHHKLIVELDSHAWHSGDDAFESDRARDRLVAAAGWTVIRVTWRQLRDQPSRLAADLLVLLRQSPSDEYAKSDS
jgi:Protein of unknown function (DUF559)